MKVWVVIGRVDYEKSTIEAVLPTREAAWTLAFARVSSWDGIEVEEWEVGAVRARDDDRLRDEAHLAASCRSADFESDVGWGTMALPDGRAVHVWRSDTPSLLGASRTMPNSDTQL